MNKSKKSDLAVTTSIGGTTSPPRISPDPLNEYHLQVNEHEGCYAPDIREWVESRPDIKVAICSEMELGKKKIPHYHLAFKGSFLTEAYRRSFKLRFPYVKGNSDRDGAKRYYLKTVTTTWLQNLKYTVKGGCSYVHGAVESDIRGLIGTYVPPKEKRESGTLAKIMDYVSKRTELEGITFEDCVDGVVSYHKEMGSIINHNRVADYCVTLMIRVNKRYSDMFTSKIVGMLKNTFGVQNSPLRKKYKAIFDRPVHVKTTEQGGVVGIENSSVDTLKKEKLKDFSDYLSEKLRSKKNVVI